MKNGIFGFNSVILGGLAAGLSIAIVLGGLLLAFTEGGRSVSIEAFPTLESVSIITPTAPEPTPTAVLPTTTPTAILSPTATLPLVVEVSEEVETCNTPAGWLPYTITRADTLNKLSASAGLSPQQLADANCLKESRLTPDSVIYLPPATPTSPPVTCGAPRYWVVYYVQRGDTLSDIARRTNSTVSQLKNANCLNSNNIRTGQKLLVPFLPAPKPEPTMILPSQTPTPPLTSTLVPSPTPKIENTSTSPPPYPYPAP